jgi:hypothetical protein
MYKIIGLNEFEVLEIIDKAVAFGVEALNGEKNAMALQIAAFWLEGYIYGNKPRLTEDDIKSLRATMKNYFFI